MGSLGISILDISSRNDNISIYAHSLVKDKYGLDLALTGIYFYIFIRRYPWSGTKPQTIANLINIDNYRYKIDLANNFDTNFKNERQQTVERIIIECDKYVRDIKEKFSLIIENERFCYYLWATIIHQVKPKKETYDIEPDQMVLLQIPLENEFYTICNQLINTTLSNMSLYRVLTLIFNTETNYVKKNIYTPTIAKFKILELAYSDFLNEVHNDIDQAFDYLVYFCKKKNKEIDEVFLIQTLTKENKCLTFDALFYTMFDDRASTETDELKKTLDSFIKSYRKATIQKRYRSNEKKQKKELTINKESLKTLRELAKYEKLSQSQILEKIINNYYEQSTKV